MLWAIWSPEPIPLILEALLVLSIAIISFIFEVQKCIEVTNVDERLGGKPPAFDSIEEITKEECIIIIQLSYHIPTKYNIPQSAFLDYLHL